MFSISVDFLTRVAVSTAAGSLAKPEWPPHPERLFRAFVAAWGDGGEDAQERLALEWFERCAPPVIEVPVATERAGHESTYVPVNDSSVSGRVGAQIPAAFKRESSLAVLPAQRTRQVRSFPSVVLSDEDAVVTYRWPYADADPGVCSALSQLACRVSYLGHSHSLVHVRCVSGPAGASPSASAAVYRPIDTDDAFSSADDGLQLNVPRAGGLDALQTSYRSGSRPETGRSVAYRRAAVRHADTPATHFAGAWIVLRASSREAFTSEGPPLNARSPALTSIAYVSDQLRRSLIAGLSAIPDSARLPDALKKRVLALISGHDAAGAPLQEAHVAIVPLTNVGLSQYSDGTMFGLGIVPPRASTLREQLLLRDVISAAIDTLSARRSDGDALILRLSRTHAWSLTTDAEPSPLVSLSTDRFTEPCSDWSTLTPMVLDQHPKSAGDVERLVVASLRHVGLDAPTGADVRVEIVPHKHCVFAGSEPAWPRSRAPEDAGWVRQWRQRGEVRDAFDKRPMTHVTLHFRTGNGEPLNVAGPLLLGAGRYLGLGLCAPLPAPRRASL